MLIPNSLPHTPFPARARARGNIGCAFDVMKVDRVAVDVMKVDRVAVDRV